MTSRATFRIGGLKTGSEDPPTPKELADRIEDSFTTRSKEEDPVSGETVRFAEKGRNEYYTSEYGDYNFCFFTYVADTADSYRIRNDDDEEKEESQVVLELAWVIYFENGQFAFQSRDDIADAWAPRFIKKRTGHQITNDDFRLDQIGQAELKQWYDSADRISKIKFTKPGDSSSDITNNMENLRELAETASGLSFSVGQGGDTDLREANLIGAAVDALDIQRMNVKNGDENMTTLKQSGRVHISWNESDWDEDNLPRNRGQTIRSKLRPYLQAVKNAQ